MTGADVGSFIPRASLLEVRPYVADGPRAPLHLADNTNLFGMPPSALRAASAVRADDLAHYPPSSGPALREAVAAYIGVEPNEIVIGCGADDIIDCAFRAFCEPGAVLAFSDPTFVMARHAAVTNSLRPCAVPFDPGGGLDTDALIAAAGAATYVCAPNNPTGIQPAAQALRDLLQSCPGVLIIDEAYAEFAGSSLAGIAPSHGRLVVVRTFSKAFGLAGLRVGYAVGAPALVREIEKARGPFRVSTVALRAAQEALTNDLEWMRARVADAITSREEFVRLLRARGFAPLPSAANFVLVPVAQATKVADRLWQNGIGVRAFTQLHRIGDAVRVTIAPREAMIRVADALATAVL